MRRTQSLKVLTLLFSVSGAATLLSCAASQEHAPTKSQDRALIEFGASHPSCRVWTNWNKVCARKPGSGITECLSSADAAPASEPFCASGPDSNFDRMTASELESSNRFCADLKETVLDKTGQPPRTYRVCRSHLQNRPFSKMRLPAYFCRNVTPIAPHQYRPGEIDVGGRRISVVPAVELEAC